MAVYNEAGELVKILLIKNLPQVVQGFQTSSATLSDAVSAVAVSLLGTVTTWDGTNQGGTAVTNGKYFIKVQSTDPSGVVSTVTETITVDRTLTTVSVAVYNEAGEEIKNLYQVLIPASKALIQSMSLSSGVISPGNPYGGSMSGATTIVMDSAGGSVTLTWDGSTDQGTLVDSGQYFVEARWVGGNGDQTIVKQVAVVNGRESGPGPLVAAPNMLTGGQTMTVFSVTSSLSLTLKAQVYDTAGERVGVAEGPAGTNEAGFNTAGLANGLYIAVVEVRDAVQGALMMRKTVKIVVRR